jgi:hypothetical protein
MGIQNIPWKTEEVRMNIPEGYNRRLSGSTIKCFNPVLACESCGRHVFVLFGIEKPGCRNMSVCYPCLDELYMAQRAALEEAARIEAAHREMEVE